MEPNAGQDTMLTHTQTYSDDTQPIGMTEMLKEKYVRIDFPPHHHLDGAAMYIRK